MTDEELEDKATDWIRSQGWSEENLPSDEYVQMQTAYVAGAKENGVVWHDLRKNPDDLPKKLDEKKVKTLYHILGGSVLTDDGIHRKILVQDRHNNIYTASFYPKDESHKEDCFSVDFISKGFQGANFVAFGQITKWCEFPKFEVGQ